MKKKDFLWSLLAIVMAATLSVGLSSCSKDDDPELSVNKTSISLQANGDGDKDVTVSASHTDWNVSVTDGSAWLRVNKNGQLATVSVDANTTTQTRTGKFTITATADASLSYVITVSQAGVDGVISLSVSSIEFQSEGGSETVTVTSNSGWNASSNQGWLTVSPSSGNAPTSGSGATSATLTASENKTNSDRTCTVTFTTTDGKASATISITQKKQTPYILVNGLESTSLQFSSNSGVNYKQTVKISSNVSWSMSGVPEWLSVSPTNGNGDLSIDIYPKSDNNQEDKERTTQLVLLSGETRATIKVSQDTDLDPDAYVNPTNIITLYNGIAFDYEFGKNVSYYYRGYMEKSTVASMTDAEIITVLEENFARYTQADDEVADFSGLDEGKAYMVYTVGYNKNGKRGKLTKTEITTKTLQNNEPMAWISDPTTDGANWYWTIEKSATCYSYYMISTDDFDLAISSDVFQAWMIDYYIRKGWTSEYVNGGDWYAPKSSSMIAIMTWGLDKKENFAGKTDWNFGVDISSAPNRVQKQSKNVKADKNHKIPGKGKLTIYKKK